MHFLVKALVVVLRAKQCLCPHLSEQVVNNTFFLKSKRNPDSSPPQKSKMSYSKPCMN